MGTTLWKPLAQENASTQMPSVIPNPIRHTYLIAHLDVLEGPECKRLYTESVPETCIGKNGTSIW